MIRGLFQCTMTQAQMRSRKKRITTTTSTTTTVTMETTTLLAVKTTTVANAEEWRRGGETEEVKTFAVPATTEAMTEIVDDAFDREREEEEEEGEEEERGNRVSEFLNATDAFRAEFGPEKENLQIEKVGFGCKTLIGIERMAIELLLLVSLMLNFYLMLVYPVLIFMGRKWLKEQIQGKGKREGIQGERQMLPGMRLDIEIEERKDRQKESEKESKAKCSWFRLCRSARFERGEK